MVGVGGDWNSLLSPFTECHLQVQLNPSWGWGVGRREVYHERVFIARVASSLLLDGEQSFSMYGKRPVENWVRGMGAKERKRVVLIYLD